MNPGLQSAAKEGASLPPRVRCCSPGSPCGRSSTTDTASATPPLSRGAAPRGRGRACSCSRGRVVPTERGCLGKGGKGEKAALPDSAVTANNPCLHRATPGLKFSAETEFIAVIPGEGRALMLAAAAAKGTGGRERAGEATAGQSGSGALLGRVY